MDFKDRVANKPNRVKLTFEDSGASSYAVVELADEPIEEGTPLNAFNMNKLLNKEDSDYIVEQGTSGIWTYEKWNSGKAKCRGSTTYVADNFGAAFGTGSGLCTPGKGTTKIDYPFEFVERPVEFAFIKTSMFPVITATDVMGRINTTSHTGQYKPVTYTIAGSNVTPDTPLEFIVDYIVEGKWK